MCNTTVLWRSESANRRREFMALGLYIRLFARHRVPARVAQESGFYAEHLSLYRVVELPPSRRETHNYLDLYWWKHSIYALLEVDVTRTRQFIEDHKAQTGEALSFTGYLAFCLARAVDEDKSVQAYLKGRKHLVVFDDVDVFLPVERELGGTPAAIPYIIRRANHKSFLEIHREIRDFQSQPVPPGRGAALGVPGHDVSPLAAASAVRPTHSRRQPPRPRPRCDGSGHGRRDSARHGWSRRRLGPGAGRAITAPDRG